jgi:hypothetical protein
MYCHDNLRHTEDLIFRIIWRKSLKIAREQSDLTFKLAKIRLDTKGAMELSTFHC